MKTLIINLGAVTFLILLAILMAFPVMWLWNWLMPVIFKLPTITVSQALGLNILSGLLLRSSISKSKDE